jgi:topoisomerase-4 subunit A
MYLTANPNGEAETITVKLTSGAKARQKIFDFDFADLEIKGRGAGGNILTRYPVRKIEFKAAGASTLTGLNIWYDKSVGRLNRDNRGEMIGNFNSDDNILVIYKDGHYELTSYELTNRYEADKISLITRFDPKGIVSAVHYDGAHSNYYVKRFTIETTTLDKKYCFISEEKGSKLMLVSIHADPKVEIDFIKGKGKDKEQAIYDLNDLIDVKGWKAIGNKLSPYMVKKVKLIEPETAPAVDTSVPNSETAPAVDTSVPNSETAPADVVDEHKVDSSEGSEPAAAPIADSSNPKGETTPAEVEKKKHEGETTPASDKPKTDNDKKDDSGFGIGQTIELDF